METVKIPKEILTKLARLEADVEDIKLHIKLERDKELETEMKDWEETSAGDASDFFEKHNL